MVQSSQLRSFFSEIRRIELKEFEKSKSNFIMLKPKLVYAIARNKSKAPKKYELFKEVVESLLKKVDSEEKFKNFVLFMEAVVAYHKAFGGE
jgi:CRISPR-associated protein Csm2